MDELLGPLSNSAGRAVAIVEFLSSNPNQTFTLSEIARLCSIRKSTAYTVLRILHEAGWLTRSPLNLEYGLGPTLITIGRAAEETRPEVNLARPVMERVSASFQRVCVLSTTLGNELLVLEVTGRSIKGIATPPGHRVPWVAPYGTVFVAWRERAVRDDWCDRSSIVSSEQRNVLERVLDATVRRGYVVTLRSDPHDKLLEVMRAVSAERTIRDVRRILAEHIAQLPPVAYLVDDEKAGEKLEVETLQAPIFDSSGEARYALTIAVDLELEPEALARVGAELRGAADEITAVLAAYSRQRRVGGKSESDASS